MSVGLWAGLSILSLALMLVSATSAAIFIKRLDERASLPLSDEIGAAQTVIRKVRKDEPMSEDELQYARQIVADRGSLRTLCIPGTLFLLGCYYVFGSLEHLHGSAPSERTFLGVIPMITSTNLAFQLLRNVRLKRRLQVTPRSHVSEARDRIRTQVIT
jgi:Kef-type K+ transport system membrane component KefB